MDAPSNPIQLFLAAVGVGVLLLCACMGALSEWAHRDTHRLAPQSPFDARRKLSGLPEITDAIELIGARPDNERPPGVDWTISCWSQKRGEYAGSDRGRTR